MANIKFSQFTEKTTLGTIDFLVGYTGAENVQISPTNLLSTTHQVVELLVLYLNGQVLQT